MFDLIDITAIILAAFLVAVALLNIKNGRYVLALAFVLIAFIPLMWAGLIRFHIPQTLIWMSMYIFAIIFLWQGFLGLVTRSVDNHIFALPDQFGEIGRNILSILVSGVFAILIVLTWY